MNAQTLRFLRTLCMGLGIFLVLYLLVDVVQGSARPRETIAALKVDPPVTFASQPEPKPEPPTPPLDEYGRMLKRIATVQGVCGKLCDLRNLKGTPSKYFNNVRVPVDCDAIFKEALIDAPREQAKAPYDLPKEYFDEFTMWGKFPLQRYHTFFDAVYLTGDAAENKWTGPLLTQMADQANRGVLGGTYGAESTNALMAAVKRLGVKGKRCLVIGSERPWVEAVLLGAGAKEIVTLEYGKIYSTHPQVITMLPSEFTEGYLNGSLGLFDTIVTYSSVEHAGLGRYGDALLPWGDILAIARGWCVTKPKGDMVLAVPYGPDALMFNAHRQYGPIRYPFLAANWQQVDMSQDIFTFIKQEPL